jgi:hypothetical protein
MLLALPSMPIALTTRLNNNKNTNPNSFIFYPNNRYLLLLLKYKLISKHRMRIVKTDSIICFL